MLLGTAIVATLSACFAGLAFPYASPRLFVMRWAAVAALLGTMIAGGAAIGAVARSALCDGFWICD